MIKCLLFWDPAELVTAVIGCSVSRCAVQTHIIQVYRQTILQLRSACNLELSASCCHQL